MTLDMITDWLQHRAGAMYGGEAITQLDHALQCATLAVQEQASDELIIAALLHDLGHLAELGHDALKPHAEYAAALLRPLFSAAVTEPIRLHVAAKRYLCTSDPTYWPALSEMSKRSLEWQGGPFDQAAAIDFIEQPFAQDAVRLRQWDDSAKDQAVLALPLSHFLSIMEGVAMARGAVV